MAGYVIKRTTDGAYVSRPGSRHSYTRSLEAARVFQTREAADGDRCVGNEVVVALDDILVPS